MPEATGAVSSSKLDHALTAAAAVGLALAIVFLKSRNIVSFWYQPHLQIYSLLAGVFVLSRALLACLYHEPADTGFLPTVSITLPVKNEETHIEETILRLMASRYPEELFDLLVVDDGSTDGTWAKLQDLKTRFPRIEIVRFEKNRGKRHAMALGAERSRADVLVYLDSDSFIEPHSLRALVQPFADPRIGAVAGHCDVIPEPENFISKMEAVRYYVSQRVIKASESLFWAVTCCPGPFSAYRRDAVMRILPAWRHQMFLGAEATFGDDRSLTNFILKDYRVVYHAGAVCSTFAPNQWRVFFRQQLRWKKSFIRETTIAVRRMWRKHPVAAVSYYTSVLITMVSPIIAARAILALPRLAGMAAFSSYAGGLILMYLLLGLLYHYYARAKGWHYGVAFAVLYIFVLSFQNYYALLTARQNHWGTR